MIISCGEALVDMVPDPVAGGGPMNVAVAAARLESPAAFVGCISTDEYGQLIERHLLDNGVDISACQRSDAPTARAIVEHTPKLVFRFEGTDTADTLLEPPDLSALGDGEHIIHGGTLGLFRGRTAETLADLVESTQDGLVSFDPNIRPQIIDDRERWQHFHDRWLVKANIYKGSDEDISWIWPDRSPESSAEALLADGVEVVVLTRGEDGMTFLTEKGEAVVPAPTVDVVDTVGAGDTAVAAMLVSLVERGITEREALRLLGPADWQEIGSRAAQASAVTISRAGANPPLRSEVDW